MRYEEVRGETWIWALSRGVSSFVDPRLFSVEISVGLSIPACI